MNEARIMTLQEVRDVLNFPSLNPTVNEMIFVETRKTANNDRKVFPCYPIKYDSVQCTLRIAAVQCKSNHYFFVHVDMPQEDIGVKCRFWSAPPTEEALDNDPLPEAPAEEPEEKDEEVPPQ